MQESDEKKDSGSSTEKPKRKRPAKTAVVKAEKAEVMAAPVEWPDARIKLLRDTIAKGASPEEFELAMQVVKRTGLDPFARQIYFVSRYDSKERKKVMTWQFSIDGFRLISQRTGKYRGMVGPFWCGNDGAWKDVWLSNEPPAAAKVGIMHADFSEPVWGVATWNQYCVKDDGGAPTFMWRKMGPTMLAKCAESLGRRIAFPQELSGLYTDDEMAQAKHGEPIAMPEPTNHRAEILAKDVTPPKEQAGPQPANPAEAAAMEDDASRIAAGLTTDHTGHETPETEHKGIPSHGEIDPVRQEKILKATNDWFKGDEGKEFKSRLTRLGYSTRTLMYEKFERCDGDLENFRSVINDEFKKMQIEKAAKGA